MFKRTRGTDGATALRALSRSGRLLQAWAYSTRGVGVTPNTETSPRNNHTPSPSSEHETHTTGPVPGQTQARSSLNSPPPIDIEALRGHLRDWGVLASTSVRRRADQFSKKATTSFSHLGLHLNRATGYEEIEALKRQVVEQEARIKATRQAARAAKTAYDDAVLQRSISQRQVNDLLQRKSSWTDSDVSNFTSFVRSDHSFEQEEARTKARVAEMEDVVDREFSELMRVILARYHEEQVWSDKIRSASTYGSLAVLGVNLVVFIMAIIVVEPWKRKRLAQTFEKKVEELGAETKALMNSSAARVEDRLTGHEKLLTELITQETSQRALATTIPKEASPEETPVHFSHLHLGVIGGRELMLVAGSAAAGAVITLFTRSLFAS
ncbi:Mdm33 family-domain-containing protein [Boletus coccyginus]|nr:Mdm33 family-domain-containing protein [Boletus coccyginus]